MRIKPTFIVVARMARNRQILADQLVLGLVTGGLMGPGMVIATREEGSIRFGQLARFPLGSPVRGELLLAGEAGGETVVECRVWCGTGLAEVGWAGLWGAVAGSLVLGLGGSTGLALGLGLAVLGLAVLLGRWGERSSLRQRIQGFLRNTTYLKSM